MVTCLERDLEALVVEGAREARTTKLLGSRRSLPGAVQDAIDRPVPDSHVAGNRGHSSASVRPGADFGRYLVDRRRPTDGLPRLSPVPLRVTHTRGDALADAVRLELGDGGKRLAKASTGSRWLA
jgi:hypothetical protein